MNPGKTNANDMWFDEDAHASAPTSPWTDSLHQAWTPDFEAAQADSDQGSDEDHTDNPLMSAYL
jgi:hypothetical protein